MKNIIYSVFIVSLLVSGCSTPKKSSSFSSIDSSLNDLSSSSEFQIWWKGKLSDPITDRSVKMELIDWIKNQSFVVNDELTHELRKDDGALACIAVEIVLSKEKTIVVADDLLLVDDPVTAYSGSKKCCEFNLDEVLFITGILEEPYKLTISEDEALMLSHFINGSTNPVIKAVANTINEQTAVPLYKKFQNESEIEIELELAKQRILEK